MDPHFLIRMREQYDLAAIAHAVAADQMQYLEQYYRRLANNLSNIALRYRENSAQLLADSRLGIRSVELRRDSHHWSNQAISYQQLCDDHELTAQIYANLARAHKMAFYKENYKRELLDLHLQTDM